MSKDQVHSIPSPAPSTQPLSAVMRAVALTTGILKCQAAGAQAPGRVWTIHHLTQLALVAEKWRPSRGETHKEEQLTRERGGDPG